MGSEGCEECAQQTFKNMSSDDSADAAATMKVSSLEDVHKLASDKGMAVVDEQQTTDDLESRFHDVLIEADELSLKQDPETEPYKSKYAANKMMEEMLLDTSLTNRMCWVATPKVFDIPQKCDVVKKAGR